MAGPAAEPCAGSVVYAGRLRTRGPITRGTYVAYSSFLSLFHEIAAQRAMQPARGRFHVCSVRSFRVSDSQKLIRKFRVPSHVGEGFMDFPGFSRTSDIGQNFCCVVERRANMADQTKKNKKS